MTSGRRQCRQERRGDRCLPHAGPHTNVDPPHALAGLTTPLIVSTHRGVAGLTLALHPPPFQWPAGGLITHDRRVAAAGATRRKAYKSSWQASGKRRPTALGEATGRVLDRPELLVCGGAPAGIEPATPSSPWNHREPLCEPPLSQVTLDRNGRSYRFSFDGVMRSVSGHAANPGGRLQTWAQCWARSWSSARSSASTLARIRRSSWPAATSTA